MARLAFLAFVTSLLVLSVDASATGTSSGKGRSQGPGFAGRLPWGASEAELKRLLTNPKDGDAWECDGPHPKGQTAVDGEYTASQERTFTVSACFLNHRLYEVDLNNEGVDKHLRTSGESLLEDLTGKYGRPRSHRREQRSNELYDVYSWRFPDSVIQLEWTNIGDDLERVGLGYYEPKEHEAVMRDGALASAKGL